MPIDYSIRGLTAQQVWFSTTSIEVGPNTIYPMPAGLYDFGIFNSGIVNRTVEIHAFINGAFRIIWDRIMAPGEAVSIGPFISDGVNMRYQSPADVYARLFSMPGP